MIRIKGGELFLPNRINTIASEAQIVFLTITPDNCRRTMQLKVIAALFQ
jgi:hypothetical protein